MSHLRPSNPNVYCLRFGKPFAVTTSQFNDWFTDNSSADLITKKQYLEQRKLQMQKGSTICLSTYCTTPLTQHNHGYCDTCADFQAMEYETNEPN